jgi:hypothetical protein
VEVVLPALGDIAMKAITGFLFLIGFTSLLDFFAEPLFASPAVSLPGSDGPVVVSEQRPPRTAYRLPVLGVAFDVGLPDGINLSLVGRPCPWSRIQMGVGSNGIGFGWRAGVTLLPFKVGPAAVVEYGHYYDGNANAVAGLLVGSGFHDSPLFDHVGYDYVNLHLGLNFGYRRVVFFVQAGLSIVRGHIHDANQAASQATANSGGTEVTVHSAPTIKATGLAGKLGVIAYVW